MIGLPHESPQSASNRRKGDPVTLDPQEVLDKQFQLAVRGYDRGEVDEFLQLVAEELRAVHAISAGNERNYEHMGRDIESIMDGARTAAETIRERAREEADAIRQAAREDADRIRLAGEQHVAAKHEGGRSLIG